MVPRRCSNSPRRGTTERRSAMPRKYSPRLARVCPSCGGTFACLPSKLADGRGKFCSVACKRAFGAARSPAEVFWPYVDRSAGPDGCWPWTRGRVSGYGKVTYRGERILAHRLSYELAYGPIPADRFVLHRC